MVGFVATTLTVWHGGRSDTGIESVLTLCSRDGTRPRVRSPGNIREYQESEWDSRSDMLPPGPADSVRPDRSSHVLLMDNLMLAKVFQADHANRKRGSEDAHKTNDLVMLSMANRRKDYASTGSGRKAKLFPRQDGPYRVVEAFPTLPIPVSVHPSVPSHPPSLIAT
jgi:hypothetical protein